MSKQAVYNGKVKIVLLVEDNEAIGAFLSLAITEETPYRAVLVPDGFRALEVLEKIRPNLLILDYSLPGMNGIELYDRLESTQHIPTIMISARLPEQEVKARHIIGMQKPIDLNELLDVIGELLG
jgi:DNA-binding response OmpR family regulator